MGIVRAALVVSATIAAPTMMLQPPLKSGPGGGDQNYAVLRLSPLAIAGHALYRQYCSTCHGEKASGTERGPSLQDGDVATGKFERMTFHLVVRQGRHAPEGKFGSMPAFDLSFNEIEMIGRYLREVGGRELG
jgi:mono/diheme cytochrome c family protein